MVHLVGYLALVFGIVAMGMRRMVFLRIIHMLSAATYVVYGSLIEATPLVLGGGLFLIIHGYHLFLISKAQNESK